MPFLSQNCYLFQTDINSMSMNQCMWPYGATYDADWVEGAVCHALAPLLVQVVLPWVAFIAFQKRRPAGIIQTWLSLLFKGTLKRAVVKWELLMLYVFFFSFMFIFISALICMTDQKPMPFQSSTENYDRNRNYDESCVFVCVYIYIY